MNIKVFKFGGASVKDAQSVRNLVSILNSFANQPIVVVVSAMGKTTNALEKVVEALYRKSVFPHDEFQIVVDYHISIIDQLFDSEHHQSVKEIMEVTFASLKSQIEQSKKENFDFDYDQIVSYGEVISTQIIHQFLQYCQLNSVWVDARKLIKTNNLHREASIDWEETNAKIQAELKTKLTQTNLVITQGFIGSNDLHHTTTLGREGSDFSGALFAWALNAESLTIWKDVPGLLNADPKIFDNTVKINKLSYGETVELAYYGATIIHPKTIKPLQNKQIPLYVKSFLNPTDTGSVIHSDTIDDQLIASYIVKKNQLLLSISPRDYSFMSEEHLAKIFSLLASLHIKVNMMQVSAISFSICIDDNPLKYNRLIEEIKNNYKIKYNQNLELLTIRHYLQTDISSFILGRKILLEQRSRTTLQLVMEEN